MLNAIEPGSVMAIHRHLGSSETVVCVRGHFEEYLYDENGVLIETVDMRAGGAIVNVPVGQWHNLKSLESERYCLKQRMGRGSRWGRMRYGKRKEERNVKINPKRYLGFLLIRLRPSMGLKASRGRRRQSGRALLRPASLRAERNRRTKQVQSQTCLSFALQEGGRR